MNNAKLQVNIITLQSQISSLTSQHTALQLANSQLAAEKEEVGTVTNTVSHNIIYEQNIEARHKTIIGFPIKYRI